MSVLQQVLANKEAEVLSAWIAEQASDRTLQKGGSKSDALKEQSAELLGALREGVQQGNGEDIQAPGWTRTREILTDISAHLIKRGLTPAEVATFVFSLKRPLFQLVQTATAKTPEVLANELWTTNQLLDRLGLFITEVALESREKTISRQQTEMLELSTPVVKLWDGILALPLIGTLDSERTQIVMENLLQEIVRTGAGLAIIDITGVPTVDTLVAQHLLKTVAAARLMGAECIISGIRPQIASTIVHLGVDLGDVSTKATLADAFAVALRKLHLMVARMPHSGTSTE
ncbi:MAG TPA: anti-anti-sigma factor [Solibacterales bacterium]|nr:anti-anti-sigma factor [Bryobacterales bacterium]